MKWGFVQYQQAGSISMKKTENNPQPIQFSLACAELIVKANLEEIHTLDYSSILEHGDISEKMKGFLTFRKTTFLIQGHFDRQTWTLSVAENTKDFQNL